MINHWVDKRYELKQQLMQTEEGTWYRAIDTSLKREIMILLMGSAEHDALLEAQREMRNGAELYKEDFLHILNAGSYDEHSYIIFQGYSGMPLFQYVENHAVSLRTMLQWVFRAGQLLQEGQRTGLPDFSVSFDNLWITEDQDIVVMNYWKEASSSRTGTRGLIQLLYQCVTLHALAPRQLDIYINRIQSALKQEQPAIRQSVITFATKVYEDDPSIMSLMIMLKEMIEQPSIPLQEERRQPVCEEPEISNDTMMFTPVTDPVIHTKQASSRDRYGAERIEQLMKAQSASGRTHTSATDEDRTVSNQRTRKMMIIAATAGSILFLSLMGVAIIWANSLIKDRNTAQESGVNTTVPADLGQGSSDENSSTIPDANEDTDQPNHTEQDEPASAGNTTAPEANEQPDSEQVPPTSDPAENGNNDPDTSDLNTGTPDSTPEGTAPNLIGLTLEEAENQALAAGMGYEFFIENIEGVEAGKVFKQEPAAGTEVKEGDRITFYVAREQ